MTKILRHVDEGEMMPLFYGFAYRDVLYKRNVCAPVPFNFIVGWARSLWFTLMYGPKSHHNGTRYVNLQDELDRAYFRGRMDAERREDVVTALHFPMPDKGDGTHAIVAAMARELDRQIITRT